MTTDVTFAVKTVQKWIDGGGSSWGVPMQSIQALAALAMREPSPQGAPDQVAEALVEAYRRGFAEADESHVGNGRWPLHKDVGNEGAGNYRADAERTAAALTRQPVSPKSDIEAILNQLEDIRDGRNCPVPLFGVVDDLIKMAKALGGSHAS